MNKDMSISDLVWNFKLEHTLYLTQDEVKEMDTSEFLMIMMNYDTKDIQTSIVLNQYQFKPFYVTGLFNGS